MAEIIVTPECKNGTYYFTPAPLTLLKSLRVIGFYGYELQLHGLTVCKISGDTLVDMSAYFRQLHRALTHEKQHSKESKLSLFQVLLTCANNLEISYKDPRSQDELLRTEWNLLNAARAPAFSLVPMDDSRVESEKIIAAGYTN